MVAGILRIKIAVARHTAEAPEILVFVVAAVTPAEGLEGNEVAAGDGDTA